MFRKAFSIIGEAIGSLEIWEPVVFRPTDNSSGMTDACWPGIAYLGDHQQFLESTAMRKKKSFLIPTSYIQSRSLHHPSHLNHENASFLSCPPLRRIRIHNLILRLHISRRSLIPHRNIYSEILHGRTQTDSIKRKQSGRKRRAAFRPAGWD